MRIFHGLYVLAKIRIFSFANCMALYSTCSPEPRNGSWITKVRVSSRSLSKIRRIYCGCVGFGQMFLSFSLNSPTIRLKRSKHLTQTSTPSQRSLISDGLLGAPGTIQKCLITTEETTKILLHHVRQCLTRLFCTHLLFLG